MPAGKTRECLLVVDDSADTRELLQRNLTSKGYEVLSATDVDEALSILRSAAVDVVITDLKMPGASGLDLVRHVRENLRQTEVMMITGYPSIDVAVAAVKSGAEEYLTKPFTKEELFAAVERVIEKLNHRRGNQARSNKQTSNPPGIIGDSEAMQKAIKAVYKSASVSTPVLIVGERSTGKDLLAQTIHCLSPRAPDSFITIDCPSWPEKTLESRLFGESLADRPGQKGLMQNSGSGTLYLKEISGLTLELQEKLTVALERRQSASANLAEWALIASSSGDLPAFVNNGRFSEELLVRLSMNTISVPPLRERGSDALILAGHFLAKYSQEEGRKPARFSEKALQALASHSWPGNFGELQNLVRQLVRTVESSIIDIADLPSHMRYSMAAASGPTRSLAEMEAIHIRNVMVAVGGNKSRAAEILGINRKTLRQKLRQTGLSESQSGGGQGVLPDE
jgi:DNA-binding NtrC family response regulator